ncbi:hypothetical protein [Croceitalea dokdonensis]|nr:hypothetical protein [Croceitalea dokdonensis]
MNDTCIACGSNRIMKNLSIVDKGESNTKYALAIESYKNPDALLFKGTTKHQLKATVCGSCGHTTFSVANHQELWQNHQKK